MEPLRFDGDVIIVTGAGGGMGRCHALELASRGARVVVNDLGGHPFGGGGDPGLAASVVDEIRAAGGEAVANTASVATVGGAASLTEQAMDEWGRLDAVVSNAAILRDLPFDEMSVQDFDDVIAVNLLGAMRVLHPAFKVMKAGAGGRIVVVTSNSGLVGAKAQTNYGASKSALLGLTRSLALEGEPHGILANLLAPGALGTRMHTAMLEAETFHADESAGLVQSAEAMEWLRPDRVSPMVSVLTHPTCPVTGEIFGSWGGWFGRFAVTLNGGWSKDDDVGSAEDIVEHWDEVMDRASAQEIGLNSFSSAAS